jgi:hypothetical protein
VIVRPVVRVLEETLDDLAGKSPEAGAIVRAARARDIIQSPLRQEPSPFSVALVRHFGIVGLVIAALGQAWYRLLFGQQSDDGGR